MKREKKDNSNGASGGDGASGSSKRPSRTIELEAEEVEITVKTDEDEPAVEEGPDEAAGSLEPPEETGDEPPPPPAPPSQRTKPSEVKSFVTHLAAGLAGGLVGVIGAGIALDKLPLAGLMGTSEAPEQVTQIAQIEQRLTVLDGKLSGQSKSLEGVARAEKLDALEARLAVVENKPEAAPGVPQDFTDRLGKLENTLKTLISAAGEEGASGLEQSAALTARIDAVSSNLEKRSAALRDEIAELNKALEARAASQSENSGPDVSALGPRIKALETSISELAARPVPARQEPVGRGKNSQGAALALAFESLWRGVESGEAYAPQLEALAKLAPDGLDLSDLEKMAGAGVGTERALLRTLPPLLREARTAAVKSDDDTFLDRLVLNARTVVRVRRVGPAEGDSNAAVLARMEAQIKASDLAGVLREAKGLSGPALGSVKPWLDRAGAHQASRAGLYALEKSLLASLKPGLMHGPGAKK